jgi:cobalamin biosynthesis protein CobW
MAAKIPATVVTGFLGAGKTSLIRHLIETANGKRLAFIINEFGDLGVDRDLLLGCGIEGCEEDDVVELANGCICCTVADDFLPAIEAILARPIAPDHIIIETSGLAMPKPLVKAFNWPEVRTRVTVDGVLAVIDAAAVAEGRFAPDPKAVQAQREADDMLDHESPLEELFEEQLQCADMVVLNKTDLLDAEALERVRTAVDRHRRKAAGTVTATHGRIDGAVALGMQSAAEDDLDSRPSHHDGVDDHDHDDFDSFTLTLGSVPDTVLLEQRITEVATAHDVLRIKGFLNVPDRDMRLVVQAVGPRIQHYYDRDWHEYETRESRLVVIGHHDMDRVAIATDLTAPFTV